MHKQGKVVRWEAERGFGFIRSPDTPADVFFHIRDFRGPGTPSEGLAVSYEEIHVGGKGPRAMAVQGEGVRRVPASTRGPRSLSSSCSEVVNRPEARSSPGAARA